ncbi:MAG: rhodanese-like domain-containing protein [Gammaproteobacteria bacterium]|nr:rhodanese-like domain-containing protein [Gammaproteobacteria bacterium]
MKKLNIVVSTALALAVGFSASANAADMAVKINKQISSVTVKHNGKSVTIMRDQNQKAEVIKAFAKTSRKCPPFCIQPSTLAPGVETIAEVEVLDYLDRLHNKGDKTILVVDSRTDKFWKAGTIPGAVSIPFTKLSPAKGADPLSMSDIMEGQFNAKSQEGIWDFSKAKTLVLFCNGMWCGQSPANIKQLLKMGYPAHKIKWYRGGMQNWSNLGLTTISNK